MYFYSDDQNAEDTKKYSAGEEAALVLGDGARPDSGRSLESLQKSPPPDASSQRGEVRDPRAPGVRQD